MSNPILSKSFTAGGTIPACTMVKFGADDRTVVAASAVSDLVIGVTESVDKVIGEVVDVILIGIAWTRAGAAVVRGNRLSTDASGRGVPIAAATDKITGIALASASAAEDQIPVLLKQW